MNYVFVYIAVKRNFTAAASKLEQFLIARVYLGQ